MKALSTILKDHWEWRKQIAHLALFELMKKARGAVFGWLWLVVKPIVFIAVFWFALEVGLRASDSSSSNYPYFLWLISGLVPWFFMSDMLGTGSDVFHRYSYLVNKVKFPLSGISTLFSLSALIINAVLFCLLFIVYAAYGMPWDIHLLQVPVLMLLMFVFWDMFSIMTSQVSGISKDFGQLLKAFQQPLFWISGVLFNMATIANTGFSWAANLMLFNPITFFVTAFRGAICDKVWFWEDPVAIGCFAVVFFVTLVVMLLSYSRLNEEVADVL